MYGHYYVRLGVFKKQLGFMLNIMIFIDQLFERYTFCDF